MKTCKVYQVGRNAKGDTSMQHAETQISASEGSLPHRSQLYYHHNNVRLPATNKTRHQLHYTQFLLCVMVTLLWLWLRNPKFTEVGTEPTPTGSTNSIVYVYVFRRVCKKMRKATIRFVMSVRPSVWNNSAPARRILMKLYIYTCFEICRRKTGT